jgi:hypothetical protein
MPTLINELAIEPKAEGPKPDAKAPAAKPGPELERELEKLYRLKHERTLRVRA